MPQQPAEPRHNYPAACGRWRRLRGRGGPPRGQEQVALALRRPRVLRQRAVPVAHVHRRGAVGLRRERAHHAASARSHQGQRTHVGPVARRHQAKAQLITDDSVIALDGQRRLRATSPTGAADVREGRAALPERFSDDWIHEIGPKCSAAIQAAQMSGAELVVLVPPVRLHTLTRAMQEAVELVQDPTLRQEFIERMAITFRGVDEAADVTVSVKALGDGPDAVAMRLFRRLRTTMPTPPDEAPPSASEAAAAPSSPDEPSSDTNSTPAL